MMKKSLSHNETISKPTNFVKTIIFDLSGVLLVKASALQFLKNSDIASPLLAVNFNQSIALLKACKGAGHNLYVLSNLSVKEYEQIKQEPEIASLFSFFDDIVISEMTPYEKPDSQIFTYLCNQYNVKPENCIFIDDKQDNLNGAQRASITKTILCSDFDLTKVRKELISYGIILNDDYLELNIPTGQA